MGSAFCASQTRLRFRKFFFFSQRMNSKSTVHVLCERQFYCLYTVYALFMGPTITLFRKNIKNGSHGTIYTFKNYFATVFFSFQFQFSVFSCIQTDPNNTFAKAYLVKFSVSLTPLPIINCISMCMDDKSKIYWLSILLHRI